MRTLHRSLLATTAALALLASGPTTAQFSNVYFFGDSLTDAGNYKGQPTVPPGTGLFTTNPGPVWPTVFAGHFGLLATPSVTGGNDFAYGGARVTQLPGVPPVPPTDVAVPIATQVQQFLARGPLDTNAIYSINGGGNDFFFQLASGATPAQIQAALGAAAVQLGTQVAILNAAGARYVLIWNVPDLGLTPFAQASGLAPSVSALSSFFNTTLQGTLDAVGGNSIRLNTFLLFHEVVANPGLYGLQNVTGVACTVALPYLCTPSTLVAANAPLTYLFSNPTHPTTAGHQLLADYAISFIDGPRQMGALGNAPLAVEEANFRALDNRMWSSLNAPRPTTKFQGWAAYDYSHGDLQAGPTNGSGHINTVAVGLDMKVTDHMLAGAMFGYSDTKGNFGGPGGDYKLKQPVGTAYVGYGEGPWYVGATFGAGNLDYSDISRVIPLGAALRAENSEARGYEFTGRILGGYWFTMRDLMHGPYARVQYTKAVVKDFSEQSSDSTALNYDRQERKLLLWSLGWQVAGNIGAIRPYARATWEIDSKDQDRCVGASSVTLGGYYCVPVAKPDNSWALFSLGASTELGAVTGFIAGSATAGRTDGNYWAITVGLRTPL
jgi:outer membrane lipase/esterase